jgi:hypothetical protein
MTVKFNLTLLHMPRDPDGCILISNPQPRTHQAQLASIKDVHSEYFRSFVAEWIADIKPAQAIDISISIEACSATVGKKPRKINTDSLLSKFKNLVDHVYAETKF